MRRRENRNSAPPFFGSQSCIDLPGAHRCGGKRRPGEENGDLSRVGDNLPGALPSGIEPDLPITCPTCVRFMAKSRRSKPYQIRLQNGIAHNCARSEWERIVARGLASPVTNGEGRPSQRIAAIRPGVVVSEVAGRLQVVDASSARTEHIGTNAAIIDRLWVLSKAGASPIPRRVEAEVRGRFGTEKWREAEAYLREKRRQWRAVLVGEQFGFLTEPVI